MELNDRLRAAILEYWQPTDGRPSIRAFHRAIEDRTGGHLQGTSYPTIHSYLSGTTEPSVTFLLESAELLGVRPAWLITGEGQPTETSQSEWMRLQLAELTGAYNESSLRDFIFRLEAGDNRRAEDRRRAVLRFSRKLHDAAFPGARWYSAEERRSLLQEAMSFLLSVDAFFDPSSKETTTLEERIDLRYDLFLRRSSSSAWYVTWSDAVLDLFARRVIGLGERAAVIEDAHRPAGQRGKPTERSNFDDEDDT